LSLYLYPRIIPIHNMSPEDGFPNDQGQLQVPPALRASFSKIEEGGAYLVDNGQICLLWLHAQVSANLLEDLFGPGKTSLPSLDPSTSSIPVLETHLNAQVRNLLQYLATVRGSKAVTIQLARQINLELAGHRKREDAGSSAEGALSSLAGIRPPYW
jgi:protein transport protein SEC24